MRPKSGNGLKLESRELSKLKGLVRDRAKRKPDAIERVNEMLAMA